MKDDLRNLKTDHELLKILQSAARKKISDKEKLEQSVSFIFGSVDQESHITKEQIRNALKCTV